MDTENEKGPSRLSSGLGTSSETASAKILEKLDAGLRSLDHCEEYVTFHRYCSSGSDVKSR